jgi:hypothetical protein
MYVVYYRIRLARGTIGASAAAATPSGGAT